MNLSVVFTVGILLGGVGIFLLGIAAVFKALFRP
jgi:hypothetical protein